jgi:hypothetical protein
VRDQQVIYIYHDKIDLLGDKQGSDRKRSMPLRKR